MKVNKFFNFLSKLTKELNDDSLTVSMAYSKKDFFVSISTHTSEKFEYDHGGYQRTVQITEKDFDKDSKKLMQELVNIYHKLLKPKTEKVDAINRD